MAQRQVPSAPRVQKIVEMPKVQFSDGELNMPVVAQRQVPMIPNVQKTVEVPQIQYVDKIVDAPVVARLEDDSVGAQTVSRKRRLPVETESADGTSDSEHGLVQGEESRKEMDETRERHAAWEDPDLLPVAPDMEAGGSHLQATAEGERIVDWTQDLREIHRMVEFLVRRERKVDVKADVKARAAGEGTLPAGRRRTRSQPPGRPRRQDQSREARCRQVVRRQMLRLWQSPQRRSHLHPRQRCPRCRSHHGRH